MTTAFVNAAGIGVGRASSPNLRVSSYRARRTVVASLSIDPQSASDALHAMQAFAVAPMSLLADTAAAVAPATEAASEAQKVGLWGLFTKGVEGALLLMHDALAGAGVPGAYGVTIILFTVAIKALTFPLNYKQMESTMKMQALTPRLRKLQTDYKDNPQVMNQMIAKLYKDESVNPLAGCLPVFVQIPVWIALYRTVLNLAKENLLDERFLFLPSLQGPVSETGQSLSTWLYPLVNGAPPIGWHDALCYLILPVILVASQFYSQKLLQPPSQDPSAAQANAVLKFMPLLIGWFSLNVPSGLGVYWVTNNLVSTAQTVFIRARFDKENPAVDESASSVTMDTSASVLASSALEEKDGFAAKSAKNSSAAGKSSTTKTKRRKRR